MKQFDAVIVGFGKGGKTLAGKLAARGDSVALVEKSAGMYGGTCINVGCIPSKSLITSAAQSARGEKDSFEDRAELYRQAVAQKRLLTAMLRKKNFDKLNDLPNVAIYNGTARFVGPGVIKVALAAGGEEELSGARVFLNTGSEPVLPPIEGIEGNPLVYTSETLMELDALPRRLVIVGGGYIGLEFASMFSNFGSQVTVLQDGKIFLPREDEDIAVEIRKNLEAMGASFRLGVSVRSVVTNDGAAAVAFSSEEGEHVLLADAVLLATGRRPNTRGLNLAAAGVEITPRGAVKVDEKLRATAPHVWAMGDVAGGLQFTYVSLDDFRNVWSQLESSFPYRAENRKNVPYSVFLDTPFSRVGLNEREAREAGYTVKVAKLPAAAVPKAQVLRHPQGVLKAVIDAKTEKILGAMLCCEESYEMINTVKLAMDLGAPYTVLRDQIFTHPTMSEALNDLFAAVN